MVSLKRVSCAGPGISRLRAGKGFRYVDAAGQPVREVCAVVSGLKRRRGGGQELLAYRSGSGRSGTWVDVKSTDINA